MIIYPNAFIDELLPVRFKKSVPVNKKTSEKIPITIKAIEVIVMGSISLKYFLLY